MADKVYLSAQQLLEDSFRLGVRIVKSGFKPTFMAAIWRGGVPIGIAVQEMLAFTMSRQITFQFAPLRIAASMIAR